MDAMDPAVRAYLAAATSFPPPTEVEHPWYLLRDRLTLEPLYWNIESGEIVPASQPDPCPEPDAEDHAMAYILPAEQPDMAQFGQIPECMLLHDGTIPDIADQPLPAHVSPAIAATGDFGIVQLPQWGPTGISERPSQRISLII